MNAAARSRDAHQGSVASWIFVILCWPLLLLASCASTPARTVESDSAAAARWVAQLPESWVALLRAAEAAQDAYHVVADTPMAQLETRETALKVEALIVAARDLNRRAQSYALKRYEPVVAESRLMKGEDVLRSESRPVRSAELTAHGLRLEYFVPDPERYKTGADPAPAAPGAAAPPASGAPTGYDTGKLMKDGVHILSQRGKRICVIASDVTWEEPFASIVKTGGSESVQELIKRLSR